jgi:hypothetical protein
MIEARLSRAAGLQKLERPRRLASTMQQRKFDSDPWFTELAT